MSSPFSKGFLTILKYKVCFFIANINTNTNFHLDSKEMFSIIVENGLYQFF